MTPMNVPPLRGPRTTAGCITDGRAGRWVLVCAAVMLVSACSLVSVQDGGAPEGRATGFPPLSPKALERFAKGDIVLRHTGESWEASDWSGRFTAGSSYSIVFDCTGVIGKASIETDDVSLGHSCTKGLNKVRVGNEPDDGEKRRHRVRVKVPDRSQWAIVISEHRPRVP